MPPTQTAAVAPDNREPGRDKSRPRWLSKRAQSSRRRWVLFGRILAFGVVLLAVRWIILRLGTDGAALAAYQPPRSLLVALALAIPLLAVVEMLPAFAWHRLLVILGGSSPGQRGGDLSIHARMQVARYLPGHAFQVGRHALTRQNAVTPHDDKPPHSTLAAAATCEAVGQIAGAAALACLGFGAAFGDGALNLGGVVPEATLRWAPWLALLAVMSIPLLLARLAGSRLLPGVVRHRSRDSFRVYSLYALYFAIQGLVFGLLLVLVHGASTGADTHWSAALFAGAGAYPLAWVIGFLTPATPAGAGSTEAVLVAVLGARYGAVEVLVAALGLRIASIAAHGLLALAATWREHRSRAASKISAAGAARADGIAATEARP